MRKVHVKTERLAVGRRTYLVTYFEQRTLRGACRYSAEIVLGPSDCIILDGDSVTNLQARAAHSLIHFDAPCVTYPPGRVLARAGFEVGATASATQPHAAGHSDS